MSNDRSNQMGIPKKQRFCWSCGHKIKQDTNFCIKCGAQLKGKFKPRKNNGKKSNIPERKSISKQRKKAPLPKNSSSQPIELKKIRKEIGNIGNTLEKLEYKVNGLNVENKIIKLKNKMVENTNHTHIKLEHIEEKIPTTNEIEKKIELNLDHFGLDMEKIMKKIANTMIQSFEQLIKKELDGIHTEMKDLKGEMDNIKENMEKNRKQMSKNRKEMKNQRRLIEKVGEQTKKNQIRVKKANEQRKKQRAKLLKEIDEISAVPVIQKDKKTFAPFPKQDQPEKSIKGINPPQDFSNGEKIERKLRNPFQEETDQEKKSVNKTFTENKKTQNNNQTNNDGNSRKPSNKKDKVPLS